MDTTEIIWDLGTAYDFFISLLVLHSPEKFGLRLSWAAGVRSRLSNNDRRVLEESALALDLFRLSWIFTLPHPKDSATVLWQLAALAPEQRLPILFFSQPTSNDLQSLLREVSAKKSWNDQDRECLKRLMLAERQAVPSARFLPIILDWWSQLIESGEKILTSLRSFQEVFFAEEERRILPYLRQASEDAQFKSHRMSLTDLLEDLSQGIQFHSILELSRLVLTPSFWSGALVILDRIDEHQSIMSFGGRPVGVSLVPGQEVPDSLLQPLKALADPTRLSILRYLTQEYLTSSEISRRLRLRAPTVIHHLHALRLAGLVHIIFLEDGEKRYALRSEKVDDTLKHLNQFLLEENATQEQDSN